jgi:hypothetical protein
VVPHCHRGDGEAAACGEEEARVPAGRGRGRSGREEERVEGRPRGHHGAGARASAASGAGVNGGERSRGVGGVGGLEEEERGGAKQGIFGLGRTGFRVLDEWSPRNGQKDEVKIPKFKYLSLFFQNCECKIKWKQFFPKILKEE